MAKREKLTPQSLGTISLRSEDFKEVMCPLLDIFEYRKVLVIDDKGRYTFDHNALRECPAESYKQIISKCFRAPGGDLIGFSNLVGGPNEEKLGSPFRSFSQIPTISAGGGKLTSAHTGRGRTPKRSPGNEDELLVRAEYLCHLARGRTRESATWTICDFETRSSTRSRVLTAKTATRAATQVNCLDDVVNRCRKDAMKLVTKKINAPEGALTKMINIIALGRESEFVIYENAPTNSPNQVSLIDFIKMTDGLDRREYHTLTGREWPFLTDSDIDMILETYHHYFPDTIDHSTITSIRSALSF